MIYFIPSWYHGNEYKENEQYFFARRTVTEFDDTVKQVQMFNRNKIMDYKILNLSYSPNFRHFLHRQSVFHAPYWSCFDAIQEIKRKQIDILSFHDLMWPEHTEFVYTQFCIIAYVNNQKYAEIQFGEDGNMIEVFLFQSEIMVRKNIYDDRGFLSATIVYDSETPVYKQYLNENGVWKICQFYEDGHIEVNPDNQFYLINNKRVKFVDIKYTTMDSLIEEVFSTYLDEMTDSTDIFCLAMHTLHHDLLENLFTQRKTILSFYQNRMELFEDAELKSLIRSTNYCIVDSKHKIRPLEKYAEKILPIVDITPFDTRADFGISQQLTVQNILVPIDSIEQSKLESLIVLFAEYFEKNETARVHFFTRNANWDRIDSVLNFVRDVLKVNGLDERLARKEEQFKAEFDLDEDEKVPIKFFVDQCVDELSISKCIREQRIMVDVTTQPDLYLQISCISSAIPQIVSFRTQYVHNGNNGFIVEDVSEIPRCLTYYLDNITNWNKCVIYSYELSKEYNTASLIRKWKGVMKQVEQD
ncbi:accessory Sec system protein Asp1 [Holdemanella biformis]|uniref:Accessory Sec system protein Asp1 n=1 Tax=Holdemanella porci TaxID=2652276 RepID=A0A6N7VJL9_9FIRM|nr:accessory Sec system protein Asp1 [Holdemanella porci]MSS56684.1 accessory Sec system protein Asp1 [Holdemanella porci]